MKKLLSLTLIMMAFATSLFALPASAVTYKCPDDAGKTDNTGHKIYCCGTTKTSIDFKCESNKGAAPGANTVTSMLLTIINFLAVGVGLAVVGGIVWGAFMYASANGNASQAQQGITFIVNSVIGLVLFILMYAFINFLVPGGLFT